MTRITNDESAIGRHDDVIKMYVVEYDHGNQRWITAVEARDLESAKRQFRRDNPGVEMVACY